MFELPLRVNDALQKEALKQEIKEDASCSNLMFPKKRQESQHHPLYLKKFEEHYAMLYML